MGTNAFSIFLAGDAMITRPWSHVTDPAFKRLVDEIRAADVSIANLETVIHEFNGYAQFDSGGTYMASPPEIAAELKWAGFDMLAHANNHTFDYGSSAILETVEHVGKAGLVLAGSGADIQEARAPRYFRCSGGSVGLVAMAATFIPYGRASRSRAGVRGRPGLNPLPLLPREKGLMVPQEIAGLVRRVAGFFGRPQRKLNGPSFKVGLRFLVGDRFGIGRERRLAEGDRRANLEAVSEAAGKADIVVASIHAHDHGPWLREFAGQAIDCGADVVFIHGPHEVRAVEIHRGKPIFYSMGDFAFEVENITRLPAEAYERLGLDDAASRADLMAAAREQHDPLIDKRSVFEGLAAALTIAEGGISRIRLIPVDLCFDAAAEQRGRPQIASPELGRRIIESVAALSKGFGTRIRYDEAANCGEVELSSLAG